MLAEKELLNNIANWDYEESPYVVYTGIERGIAILMNRELAVEEKKKIVENLRILVEVSRKFEAEIDNYFILCWSMIIDAYEVFYIDKSLREAKEFFITARFDYIIDEAKIYHEYFDYTVVLLHNIVPNLFEHCLYYHHDNVLVQEEKLYCNCLDEINNGNYSSAYGYARKMLALLFSDEYKEYYTDSQEVKPFGQRDNWLMKRVQFFLEVASVAEKLHDARLLIEKFVELPNTLISEENQNQILSYLTMELIDEDDPKTIYDYFNDLNLLNKQKNVKYVCSMIDRYASNICEILGSVEIDDSIVRNVIEYCDYALKLCSENNEKYVIDYRGYENKIAEKRILLLLTLWEKYEFDKQFDIWDELIQLESSNKFLNSLKRIEINWLEAFVRIKDEIHDIPYEDFFPMVSWFIRLNNSIIKIEKKLLCKDSGKQYSYYTTTNTFSYVLDDNKEKKKALQNRLSLMNASYMNDPNEGKVIYDVLRENNAKDKTRVYENLTNNQWKKRRKQFKSSLVFLKSFSQKIDKLTMWSEYGDKGKGCFIVISGQTFFQTERKIKLLSDDYIKNNYDDDYNIYQMLYWDNTEDIFYLNGKEESTVKNDFEAIINCIKNISYIAEKFNLDEKWFESISIEISNMLAKLSYLVKYAEYQDEMESRLIFIRNMENYDDIEIIPNSSEKLKSMLYLHYPVKTIIDEVILGPKVEEPDYYIPCIMYELEKANRKTGKQTLLSLSSIDYR